MLAERVEIAELLNFEQFFSTARPILVGQGYLLTGNFAEAQDLAQEALAQAWKNWETVGRYQDPTGWTRLVLHNLAVSRWRRLRVRLRHEHAERPPEMPPPDAGHLDVVAAINKLPIGQRRTLVLHDFVGLTLDEIAQELEVPPGTIRGWLYRARESVTKALRWVDTAGEGITQSVRTEKGAGGG
ncbi:MAG TPA: sigma-70 family RNA polymerase sigma factor [Acidimicrobiales bacterium]|nr:sigma-70 family RNA polymerase sigma factor [Acidimicrobiales bacterium]